MKHLIKFNENFNYEELNKLKKTCEEYLRYLIDDGFSIRIDDKGDQNSIIKQPIIDIDIINDIEEYSKNNWIVFREGLSWSDVKDDIIPLLELLRENHFGFNFELVEMEFFFWDHELCFMVSEELSINEIDKLINDEDTLDLNVKKRSGISTISLRFKSNIV
jgi:hypothetical protein